MSNERYFKNGEAKVLILDMLRIATEPMGTSSISKDIAFSVGLENKENFDTNRFQKTVFASLERCEENGTIERVGKDGLSILWQIKV